MDRDFKRQEKLDAISELNVTPLIDLAFSLLIIFMITTPLMEQTIQVDLAKSKEGTEKSGEIRIENISITATGAYHWGSKEVAKAELAQLLAQAALAEEEPVIHLRADRNLKFQSVVDVIEMIQKEKLSKFSIDTQAR
ncbi:MAG: biopolymer transporter ExbD [Opitutales bacterium]|jgi:biopolymer transport protein ExbD